MIIQNLKIRITPNSAPTWSGDIPARLYADDLRVIGVSLPLASRSKREYEYFDVDLWIDSENVRNEENVSVTGVPYSTRNLVTTAKSSIVIPCEKILDDLTEDNIKDFNIIVADTYKQAAIYLLEGTGWTVDIDGDDFLDLPVVTEMNPIITLNGSKLEQLNTLLDQMTPNDLWGQGPNFYVNFFDLKILITPPVLGVSNINSVDITEVRPLELAVRKQFLDKPSEIWIQELDSSLYRADAHLEGKQVQSNSYTFSTATKIEEEDENKTTISGNIVTDRFTVGDLILSDSSETTIAQTTAVSVLLGYGGPSSSSELDTFQWVTGKTSRIISDVYYEYILGPSYDPDTAVLFSDSMLNSNKCITNSKTGSRQQLSRDYNGIIINKDNYPQRLLTSDGIQILKKTITTREISSKEISYVSPDGVSHPFPGFPYAEDITTTEIEEIYLYDDDGNLIGTRKRTKVTDKLGKYTITDQFKNYTTINEGLTGSISYSTVNSYNKVGTLLSSTVTNVEVDTSSSNLSGPKPQSAYSSIEETDVLRDKLLKENTNSFKQLDINGIITEVSDFTIGNIYTSIENLILEELEEHLNKYYALSPNVAFSASFSTYFLDVRYALGGHVRLTAPTGTEPNSDILHEYVDSEVVLKEVYSSGLLDKMEEIPFRITAIDLTWTGEEPPIITIAMCQLCQ